MLDPKYNYLMVPGYGGSGETSWQTHWEKCYPQIGRVEQDDWDFPKKEAWVKRLAETVEKWNDKPIILITHSLGCGTTIHAINEQLLKNVAGIFMVALPHIDREDFPRECTGFSPLPQINLTIPTTLVISEDDDYSSVENSDKWADILNVELVNAGRQGHLGDSAKLGDWVQGQNFFKIFLKRINNL